jgi:hypothetical protein
MKVKEDEEMDSTVPAHLRYDLGVPFAELDLGKFAFYSTVAFFGESLVYYPLDVIRARLQVARAVRTTFPLHPPQFAIFGARSASALDEICDLRFFEIGDLPKAINSISDPMPPSSLSPSRRLSSRCSS